MRRTSSPASRRIEGKTVGIVANQPMVLAGVLDIEFVEEGGAVRALLRLRLRFRS